MAEKCELKELVIDRARWGRAALLNNDSLSMTDQAREQGIIDIFAKHGTKVTFVGEAPDGRR